VSLVAPSKSPIEPASQFISEHVVAVPPSENVPAKHSSQSVSLIAPSTVAIYPASQFIVESHVVAVSPREKIPAEHSEQS
jgi:hypothetical protein